MLEDLFDIVYTSIDAAWNVVLQLFSGIGLNAAGIVFAMIFATAIIMLVIRPFMYSAFQGSSDTVTTRTNQSTGKTTTYITRSRRRR